VILVDTNVWSETLRPQPDQQVLRWMREHSAAHGAPIATRNVRDFAGLGVGITNPWS